MGFSDTESERNQNNQTTSDRAILITVLMILIAIFSPFATSGYSGPGFYLVITSPTWMLYIEGGYGVHFEFLNPYVLFYMMPFLLIRVGPIYLITRYYQGRTTIGRARAGALLSDAPILVLYSFVVVIGGIFGGIGLNFPIPTVMIVGLFLLWRFPRHEPTVPWEGMTDPIPWWEEEKPETQLEPSADNQP
ncbi:MAG: hypothetical protein ACFFE2_12625 [Candidatus Thorarchaeota archaeon]